MSEKSSSDQVWTLTTDGREHRVEASGSASHHVRWYVDGALLTEKKAWEETLDLTPPDAEDQRDLGRLKVRFSTLGRARRATWWPGEEAAQAATGLGGVDLVPEPGSPAAAYEDKVRLHPTRYAVIATGVGVAKVAIPLLIGLLVLRFAISIDWPDVPFPELPDIPWPDLPALPWPDLPDISLPDWVKEVVDKAKYVVPIVIAYAFARAEIRRRRHQDELRARPADDPSESL